MELAVVAMIAGPTVVVDARKNHQKEPNAHSTCRNTWKLPPRQRLVMDPIAAAVADTSVEEGDKRVRVAGVSAAAAVVMGTEDTLGCDVDGPPI